MNEANTEILIDSKIIITSKKNGSKVGEISKGKFTISDNGIEKSVYLNLMNNKANFYIKITDKENKEYYINCTDLDKTQELYNRLIVMK